MDRALYPVEKVAANVTNKGSGFEDLNNKQLANELQKFAGYNHFSRSASSLLSEVIRRLVLSPEPTQEASDWLHKQGLMDRVIDGYRINPISRRTFVMAINDKEALRRLEGLMGKQEAKLDPLKQFELAVFANHAQQCGAVPGGRLGEIFTPLDGWAIARQVVGSLQHSGIDRIFDSNEKIEVNYFVDEDAILVMHVTWVRVVHPADTPRPVLCVESRVPMVGMRIEGNGPVQQRVVITAHPMCAVDYKVRNPMVIASTEFNLLIGLQGTVPVHFAVTTKMSNMDFWSAFKKAVLNLPDEDLKRIFGTTSPTELYTKFREVISAEDAYDICKTEGVFTFHINGTGRADNGHKRLVTIAYRTDGKYYHGSFTLDPEPVDNSTMFSGMTMENVAEELNRFFHSPVMMSTKEPALNLVIDVHNRLRYDQFEKMLDIEFNHVTVRDGWPVVLGTDRETKNRIEAYLNSTDVSSKYIFDVMVQHACHRKYQLRVRLWNKEEGKAAVRFDYIDKDGQPVGLNDTVYWTQKAE